MTATQPDELATKWVESGRRQGPLAGLRVLELASYLAGPFCACMLADFGADVIKVEPPGDGDGWRGSGVGRLTSMSFLQDNRNKRCITLDLSKPKGRELAKCLASSADVVIENFRPGRMERWGMSYAELSSTNPGLVMVRISGFGQTGPYKDKAAFGTIIEAMSSFVKANAERDGTPRQVSPSGAADMLTGTFSAFGIMIALRQREITGRGQEIDASLSESLFRWAGAQAGSFALNRDRPQQRRSSQWAGTATMGFYRCSDGDWVYIRCNANDAGVARLFNAMDRADLWADEMYATDTARHTNAGALRDSDPELDRQHDPGSARRVAGRAWCTGGPGQLDGGRLRRPPLPGARGISQRASSRPRRRLHTGAIASHAVDAGRRDPHGAGARRT